MSLRGTLRDALVAKIAALPEVAAAGATVEAWHGEEERYNEEVLLPHVGVALSRVLYSRRTTIGGAHYEREFVFHVWVSAAGDEAVAQLLEALQAGVPGALGDTGRLIELDGEEAQEAAELGRYLWVQRYRVPYPVT